MHDIVEQSRYDDSVVEYDYDAVGNLTFVDYQGTTEDTTFEYDAIGRKILEQKDPQNSTEYVYDALHRVVSQGAQDTKVEYSYDLSGNIDELTYPSGRTVQYDYNTVANVENFSTTDVGQVSFEYNNRHQETAVALPNSLNIAKDYDTVGRLTAYSAGNESATILERQYTYNTADEIIGRTLHENDEPLEDSGFKYDANSQLLEQTDNISENALNTYAYNNVGNIIDVNSVEQVYDNAGKITQFGDTSVSYDNRSNRTALKDTVSEETTTEYSWTEDNLLAEAQIYGTSASGDSDETVLYKYGAGNLLSERKHGSEMQEFVWDTNREIPVILSDGEYEYIYKNAVDRVPMAQVHIETDEVEFLHADTNGSVIASTDSAGDLVDTVEYSPYGEPTGKPLSAFGYAGEWTDDTTGHVYLRARWLDTTTGTFLSEDPLVQNTLNAFGYTEGNPLIQIDPLGLFSLDDFGGWVHDNSAAIGMGLTAASIMASATGLGAPLGIVIAVAGTAVSAYSSHESYKEGDMAGTIINAASAIPGLGFIGSTIKTARTSKHIEYLVNTTKTMNRRDVRSATLPSRSLSGTYDDMMISNSITGNIYDTTTKAIKGATDCV